MKITGIEILKINKFMNKNKKENIERYNPDISFGLTNEQVDSRKQANLVNV